MTFLGHILRAEAEICTSRDATQLDCVENSLKSIHDLCFMFALVIRYCVAGFTFIFCSDWFPRTGISPRPLMTLKPTVLVKESSRLLNSSRVQRHWASRASRASQASRASLAEDSTPILPRCCKTLQSAAIYHQILREPPTKQFEAMRRLVRHPDRPSFRYLFQGVTVLVLVLQMT